MPDNLDSTPSALTGLAPVIDARTRILVLGSFPRAASLAAQQYSRIRVIAGSLSRMME